MTTPQIKTIDDIRQEAEADYEAHQPRPVPPTPPTLARPRVVKVGTGAHLWIDVDTELGGYNRPARSYAQVFIVDRDHSTDQRIEGELTLESVETLLQELARVREEVIDKQTFLAATAEYEKHQNDWEKARTEATRRRVAEWEKTNSGKKQ